MGVGWIIVIILIIVGLFYLWSLRSNSWINRVNRRVSNFENNLVSMWNKNADLNNSMLAQTLAGKDTQAFQNQISASHQEIAKYLASMCGKDISAELNIKLKVHNDHLYNRCKVHSKGPGNAALDYTNAINASSNDLGSFLSSSFPGTDQSALSGYFNGQGAANWDMYQNMLNGGNGLAQNNVAKGIMQNFSNYISRFAQ